MNTPKFADVAARLKQQAQGTEKADNPANLADCVWKLKHEGVSVDFDVAWQELIRDFEDLNLLFNAPPPAPSFPRTVVYAANGLSALFLDQAVLHNCDDGARSELVRLAWRINVAWDAVLAGDIESIGEHVKLEEWARDAK